MTSAWRACSATLTPIDRFILFVPWLSLAIPAALWTLGVGLPARYRWAPLVASVVVFGLPHGALDHLAIPRVRGKRVTVRWLGGVGVLYLVLGGAYAVVWFLAPAIALTGFILLTWLHWGQGDLYPFRAVIPAHHLDSILGRGLTVAVRGGMPMLVPLLSHPDRYRAVVERLLGLFDVGSVAVAWAFEPRTRAAIGLGFGALTLLALGSGYLRSRSDRAAWAIDTGEVALLWWCFWVVPPLVAVGLYFAFWHSLRHVGRLMAIDEPSAELLSSLGRFARDATPLSVASLVLLVGLAALVPQTPTTIPNLVALYLVLVAVLTLPHVAVVAAMDREEEIW